jgi:hypothetical protein
MSNVSSLFTFQQLKQKANLVFSVSSFKKERAQLICEEKGHPFFFFNKLTRKTEVAMIKVLSPFKDNSFIPLVSLRVNRKTWRYTASFFIFLSQIEYAFTNFMSISMCLIRSINKQLQNLENENIIKKYHRIAYIDLLTYNYTFEPFVITYKFLEEILNLSRRRIREVFELLVYIGLLKKTHSTWHNGERDIPNSITLQLVNPLEIDTNPLTTPLTFTARFQSINSIQEGFSKGSKYVWVYDIYNDKYNLNSSIQRVGMLTEQEIKLFESLKEGDYVLFEAVVESFDEKNTRKIQNLKKPANIRGLS